MMFCPKCGSIMKAGEAGKLTCTRCGFVSGLQAGKITEVSKGPSNSKGVVVEGEHEVNPKIDAECPKCGNKEAYFWTQQTRSADEPETRFYRCTKCKHTWREYK